MVAFQLFTFLKIMLELFFFFFGDVLIKNYLKNYLSKKYFKKILKNKSHRLSQPIT
jgi:hypothetical protein